MEYKKDTPQKGVQRWEKPIFDAHIHVWKPEKKENYNPNFSWKLFLKWVNLYYGNPESDFYEDFYCLGMMQPDLKSKYEENYAKNIIFAYYLGVKEFGLHDAKKLLDQIDEAQKHEYPMLKIWFAPRMIDYVKDAKPGFKINDPRFDPVYQKIEDYGFKVIIHVADPDLWYYHTYREERHGTKKGRIDDFCEIMSNYPKIEFISAHLGSWPENLPKLEEMLNKYPQLYYDTGSTRWMVRELGKDPKTSREWFQKHKKRILFGSDLSISEQFNPQYFTTRYWSHKVFWETNSVSRELPFKDADSPFGLQIKGLGLDEDTLDHIYYKNAFELFDLE